MMEFESFERTRKKSFRFLSSMFRRNKEDELKIGEDMLYGTQYSSVHSPELIRDVCGKYDDDLSTDLENLHLSRADNPYLSSCEALADPDEASLSLTPGSPRGEELTGADCFSPEELAELHAHLIRSPPPLYWPAKVLEFSRGSLASPLSPSHRAFSPESGSDGMETERSYGARSQSEERVVSSPCPDLLSPAALSPVRGQTPAACCSPMRGQTPDTGDGFSPPPYDRTRMNSTPSDIRPLMSPRSMSQSYHRSNSHSSQQRLRSRTPDEEYSPSRFNIYTLHHRSMLRNKSESSYLVTSPGRDMVTHYQPATRRSLAQLGGSRSQHRKSSTDFLSWLPRRSRSRSRNRSDVKSMENLQSPSQVSNIRHLSDINRHAHKSLSCVGEGAGLILHEGGGAVSPRPNRKRFSGIKKSFSLKQKRSCPTTSLYVDINTQDI